MSVLGYAAGALALLTIAGSHVVVADRIVRRWLPSWAGASARLANVIVWLTSLLTLAELLGTVGWFRTVPLLTASVATALAARRLFVPRAEAVSSGPPLRRAAADRIATTAVGVCAVAVGAQWWSRSAGVVKEGISEIETLRYHLPFAARFVQDGSTMGAYVTSHEARLAYNPANFELLNAIVILPFHRELFAPLANMVSLALLLLATWCLGRELDCPLLGSLAGVLACALPIMALTQPGSTNNDAFATALFVAAIALLLHSDGDRAGVTVAALAAGLGLGTKYTLVGPIAALTFAVPFLVPAAARWRALGRWIIVVVASGAYWFVRNVVHTWSPLPGLHVRLGGWSLPYLPPSPGGGLRALDAPLTDFLRHPHVLWHDFGRSTADAFGTVWWAVLGLALIGILVACVFARSRRERVLGLVALACALSYVVTPGTGGAYFANTRYALPALVLGWALLATTPLPRRLSSMPVAVVTATVAGTVLPFAKDWTRSAALGALGVSLALATAVAIACAVLLSRRFGARSTAIVACLALLLAGWGVQDYYRSHRWQRDVPPNDELLPATQPGVLRVYHLLANERDTRIGVSGFIVHHGLTGDDLSNHVVFIGRHGESGGFERITSCPEWRSQLARDRVTVVVTAPENYPFSGDAGSPPETEWTRTDLHATEILRDPLVSVFRFSAPPDATTCPSA